MEFQSKNLLCCFLTLLLGAYLALGLQVADCEYGFSYDEESPNGPSHWGDLRPDWRTCRDGQLQSPIALWDSMAVPEQGILHPHYQGSSAVILNRGYDMRIRWHHGGYIRLYNSNYELIECHWHTPSEHVINGRRYDLEIHLVHQNPVGNIAVIGMMYEIGLPDPFLQTVLPYFKELADTIGEERLIDYGHPGWIGIESRGEYYRYLGSLTTPPCSETIIWNVLKMPATVSRAQLEVIRRALHERTRTNARPLQPLNDRIIKHYQPGEYIKTSLDKSM